MVKLPHNMALEAVLESQLGPLTFSVLLLLLLVHLHKDSNNFRKFKKEKETHKRLLMVLPYTDPKKENNHLSTN
jgi:hypothetical protein